MRRIFFLFLIFFKLNSAFSQHDLYAGGFFYTGVPFNSYSNNKSVLSPRFPCLNYGAGLSAEYRIFGLIGVEAGIMQNCQINKFKDKNFAVRNSEFEMKMKTKSNYWSWYGALNVAIPVTNVNSIYVQGGYMVNQIGGGSVSESKNFSVTNENIIFRNSFEKKNTSWFAEAGLQTKLNDEVLFLIGLKYNQGLSLFSKGDYSSEVNGRVETTDQVISKGSYFALNLGLKISVWHKDKKYKQRSPKPQQTTGTSGHQKQPGEKLDKKMAGRHLVVNKVISVTGPMVKILVWDDQKVDGDIISLILNNVWLLENYKLEKAPKELTVYLNPGENILVLHAINLGQIPPNTALLIVKDGEEEHTIDLTSDLQTSGTLIINRKP